MNTVRPVAWMTEAEDGTLMLWSDYLEGANFCDDGEVPAPLYECPTLDCRTCGNYWPSKNKCRSMVLCHGGNQYKPCGPVLLFMRLDDAPYTSEPVVA